MSDSDSENLELLLVQLWGLLDQVSTLATSAEAEAQMSIVADLCENAAKVARQISLRMT